MATRLTPSSLFITTAAAVAVAATAAVIASIYSGKEKGIEADGESSSSKLVVVEEATTSQQRSENKEEEEQEEASTTSAPVREVDVSNNNTNKQHRRILTKGSITIVHGSVTGTCRRFADQLHQQLQPLVVGGTGNDGGRLSSSRSRRSMLQIAAVEDFDWWDELINDDDYDGSNDTGSKKESSLVPPPSPALLILLLPTYTDGTWPPYTESLASALDDILNDWRVEKSPLKGRLQVAVFGMGSSEYDVKTMGKPAKDAARKFQKLGAKCLTRVVVGDDAVGTHADTTFHQWQNDLLQRYLQQQNNGNNGKVVVGKNKNKNGGKKIDSKNQSSSSSCACENNNNSKTTTATTQDPPNENGGCCQSSSAEDDEKCCPEQDDDDFDEDASYESEEEDNEPEIVDLEDLGDSILASQDNHKKPDEPREMVTPSQAKALKKEGYRLIGTHSAVKLCRWTKHQLRGRGGCYKHTFYGITSYQCMEATPSLACANKCVFCWRHHKNPVGKEWRWKSDPPDFIVDEAVKEHLRLIKETKGIPGVQKHRWEEAHTVKHCALSLVGEPIMYPRIDELLLELHTRKISTFLVSNGQHPQSIQTIRPITQLYVSVDAPTKDSLIAIDRPLFNDAWDRLKQSLVSLKDNGQRTVARLTVVKGWNSDEVEGYAKLIALGRVSLVEVKGVTFCGKSDASNLNMTNTPWHHEVVDLTRTLKEEIDKIRQRAKGSDRDDSNIPPEYGLACEHKHSCSVLLARVDQFAVDDPVTGERTWKTWIDYDKFHELAMRNAADPTFQFSAVDYSAPTPSWALFGSDEEGFDPTDTRHRKKTKYPKYTQFDSNGIPTHDDSGVEITDQERQRLTRMMEDKLSEIGGSGSTVTELRGGAKEVLDASLMFRGMVVAK